MTKRKTTTDDPLQTVTALLDQPIGEGLDQFPAAQDCLKVIAESAGEADRNDVAQLATVIAELLELVEAHCESGEGDSEAAVSAQDVLGFVRDGLHPLRTALTDDRDVSSEIDAVLDIAGERWGDYLSLSDDAKNGNGDDVWSDALDGSNADSWDSIDEHECEQSVEDVQQILAALQTADSAPATANQQSEPEQKQSKTGSEKSHPFGESSATIPADPPPAVAIEMDGELLEAFLDDAEAGISRLEQLCLAVESDPADTSVHRAICRELHTLKGASASVGLSDLAAYLHAVEDYVEAAGENAVDPALMLKTVDAFRAQMNVLAGGEPAGNNENSKNAPKQSAPAKRSPALTFGSGSGDREESLRVKASRVNRLMDLLAELVSLRNQRDSRLARLKNLRGELTRCVTRMRAFAGGRMLSLGASTPTDELAGNGDALNELDNGLMTPTGSLAEIGNDLTELVRTLDDISEPIEAENLAISQFIRQFRMELMEMRRLPVAGLFQRLNRAAQDAARVEGKKIQFQLQGEHAGLDRSLQERLYEPLLHIVRNCVSHGIEAEAERTKNGKPAAGVVTVSAKGSPTTLVIEIADDGRGIDYEAVRRRALEKGLISHDDHLSKSRLARLIFHPGFSTRQETTEISGRGVGMDVVATVMQKLRGKIDIDSVSGKGTTFRLTIPLRSVIEHAMVVRVAGQLYAVPMQFVHGTGPQPGEQGTEQQDTRGIRLRELLGESGSIPSDTEQVLLLGSAQLSLSLSAADKRGTQATTDDTPLLVDAIVGPEEVVVRSLPALLKSHPLVGGMSLSGAGEIVMLLDGQRLLEFVSTWHHGPGTSKDDSAAKPTNTRSKPILVVDDSLSARRRLVSILRQAGFETVEAGDGVEGLTRYRNGDFAAVFTDLEMPNLDGFGFLEELKSTDEAAGLPVFVASSRSEESFRKRARKLGADGYLVKPVDENALQQLIDKFQLQ